MVKMPTYGEQDGKPRLLNGVHAKTEALRDYFRHLEPQKKKEDAHKEFSITELVMAMDLVSDPLAIQKFLARLENEE